MRRRVTNLKPADALRQHWTDALPSAWRPYAQLSRLDRPIGWQLLVLPCWMGIAIARTGFGFFWEDARLALLFLIGAVAMRGAGCTYNDILDRDIDAKVERTRLRPLPSGAVSLRGAWIWLFAQCLVGLGVLLALPRLAQIVALIAIPLVALYPLMKRITWWPQVWLGLTFNWGALVAPAAIRGEIAPADWLLYTSLVLWTLGYDTIYAIQDREDDALIGVRSTARRFGGRIRPAVAIIYVCCSALCASAAYLAAGWPGIALTAPFAMHLALQAVRLDPGNGGRALMLFRANREAGLLLLAGWAFIAAPF